MRLQENTVAGIFNWCEKTSKEMGRMTVCLLDHTSDLKNAVIVCDSQHKSTGEMCWFPKMALGKKSHLIKVINLFFTRATYKPDLHLLGDFRLQDNSLQRSTQKSKCVY